jgi:hypothetical protein
MSQTIPTPEALTAVVQAKAGQDAAFRAELLSNPRAAVEKLFGTAIPPQIKLEAVEQAADTYLIVVPHVAKTGAGGELSDADLESVAGGSKSGAKKFFNDIGDGFVKVGSMVAQDAASVAHTTVSNAGAGNAANIIGSIPKIC